MKLFHIIVSRHRDARHTQLSSNLLQARIEYGIGDLVDLTLR